MLWARYRDRWIANPRSSRPVIGRLLAERVIARGAIVTDAIEAAERAAYEAGYRQGWRNGRCDRDEGEDDIGEDPGDSYAIWLDESAGVPFGEESAPGTGECSDCGGRVCACDDDSWSDEDTDGYRERRAEIDDERRANRGTSQCDQLCDPTCDWCLVGHDCPDQCGGGDDCPYGALEREEARPKTLPAVEE